MVRDIMVNKTLQYAVSFIFIELTSTAQTSNKAVSEKCFNTTNEIEFRLDIRMKLNTKKDVHLVPGMSLAYIKDEKNSKNKNEEKAKRQVQFFSQSHFFSLYMLLEIRHACVLNSVHITCSQIPQPKNDRTSKRTSEKLQRKEGTVPKTLFRCVVPCSERGKKRRKGYRNFDWRQ